MGEAPRGSVRPPGNGGGKSVEPATGGPIVEVLDLQHEARIAAELERQMEWALRHPRDEKRAVAEALALATVDDDTAASCYYTLARKDRDTGENKPIEGPSVRLAEILTYTWGHLWIDTRQVGLTDRFVTTRGAARDMQRGNAFAHEVTRRITTRSGKTYSDDMIATTAMAAGSIALRNSIFKVVPSPIWRSIYVTCRELAMGSEKDLQTNWKKAVAHFERELKVTEAHLLAWLGIREAREVQRVHVGRLRGLVTAIREGDTTVEEAFADVKIVEMPQRESANGNGRVQPSEVPVPPSPDLITRVQKRESDGRPYWIAEVRGKSCITFSTTLGADLERWYLDHTPIAELVTHDKRDEARNIVWTYIDKISPVVSA